MMRAIVALFLLGCAHQPATSLSLAVDDPALVDTVQAAGNEWTLCGLTVTAHTGPATPSDDFAVTYWDSLPAEEIGETSGNEIRYVSHTAEANVFAHEIGHAFGLVHVPHGLMAPVIQPGAHVTDLECEAIRAR